MLTDEKHASIPQQVENKYFKLQESGKLADEIGEIFIRDIAFSKGYWEIVRKVQLNHATANVKTREDMALMARFFDYLQTGEDEHLPVLANGEPAPPREWRVMVDYMRFLGDPNIDSSEQGIRRVMEDHPKIKEWLGKRFDWASELVLANYVAEKLCMYSPWRRGPNGEIDKRRLSQAFPELH